MCASTHWVASASAQAVLERGGNAFDAAVAGALRAARRRAAPQRSRRRHDRASSRPPTTRRRRCWSGRARRRPARPSSTTAAEGLDLVPGAGALAAAVPGAVDAWLLLLRDHGTWELADVLAFAIAYAEDGHAVSRAGSAAMIATMQDLFDATTGRRSRRAVDARRPGARSPVTWSGCEQYAADAAPPARDRPPARPAATEPHRRRSARLGQRLRRRGDRGVRRVRRTGTPRGTDHAGRDHRRGPGRLLRVLRARRPRWTSTASRSPRPARGARARCCCRRWRSSRASSRTSSTRPPAAAPTGCWRRSSWRSPTATRGTATRPRGDVRRSTSCSREEYAAARRALIGDEASHEFRPGAVAGREPYLPPLATAERPARRRRGGRADRLGERAHPRRHLPPRRRRPVGQLRVGHAVRWLAAVLADHPRARLLPGHPDADDLAGRGRAVGAASRTTAAHHAHADAAAARRRAGLRARHPGWRPAGPVAAALPAAHASSAATPRSRPSTRRRCTPRRCRGRSGRGTGRRAGQSSRTASATTSSPSSRAAATS